MNTGFVLSFLALALADSLNPTIIVMTLYLLSTEKPETRTASYVAGVYLTNFTLGLLVYFGLGAALTSFVNLIFSSTQWWAYAVELIAAVALLVIAATMKTDASEDAEKKPKKFNAAATFSLGMGLTFVEFSTAAPYIGAIAALTKTASSALFAVAALGIYNFIYVGIPLALFGIYLVKRDRAKPILEWINQKINRWIKTIVKIVFYILGLLLLADFVGYLFGSPLFPAQ